MSWRQIGHSFCLHKTLILVEHSKQTGWSHTPYEYTSTFLKQTTHKFSASAPFWLFSEDMSTVLLSISKRKNLLKTWKNNQFLRNTVDRAQFATRNFSNWSQVALDGYTCSTVYNPGPPKRESFAPSHLILDIE